MSVDRDYKVRISLYADNTGAREAARDLGKVGEAAEENVNVIERLGISHRALHKILHLISSEAGPEAGAALAGMASVGGGGIMIALMAVKELVEWIHKLREESEAAKKGIAEVGLAARDSAEDAAEAWSHYLEKLNETKDEAAHIEESYKRQKASLEDIAAAHAKILEAMEKEELAQAKGDKAKEEEIHARYEQIKTAHEQAASATQIDAHQKYIGELKSRQPGLDTAAGAVAADVSYLKGHPFAPPGFKIDPDHELELRVKLNEAAEAVTAARTNPVRQRPAVRKAVIEGAEERENKAREELDKYERNRDAALAYQKQLEREQKLLEQNEQARDKNKEAIEKETNALDMERDKRAMSLSGNAIGKAIELANRASEGGALTKDEGAFVQQLGSLAAGHSMNLQSAERFLQSAGNNSAQLDKILARLATLMEGNTQVLQNWMAQMEAKMATLQSRSSRPTQ